MSINGSDEHGSEGAGPAAESLDSLAGFVPRSISDIVERGEDIVERRESAPADVREDERQSTQPMQQQSSGGTTTSSHFSSHRRVAGRRRSSLSPPKTHEMEEVTDEWTDGAKSVSPTPVPDQVRRARLTMLFNSAAATTVIPTLRASATSDTASSAAASAASAAATAGRDRVSVVDEGAEPMATKFMLEANLARSHSTRGMHAATHDLISAMGIDPDWTLDCYSAIVDRNAELGKHVTDVTLEVHTSSTLTSTSTPFAFWFSTAALDPLRTF